jgi:hypothetical protein
VSSAIDPVISFLLMDPKHEERRIRAATWKRGLPSHGCGKFSTFYAIVELFLFLCSNPFSTAYPSVCVLVNTGVSGNHLSLRLLGMWLAEKCRENASNGCSGGWMPGLRSGIHY